MGRPYTPRLRDRPEVRRARLDYFALFEAIDRECARRGLSYRQMGREIGTHSSIMTRLSRGLPISSDNLVSLLAWMGRMDLTEFVVVDQQEGQTNGTA